MGADLIIDSLHQWKEAQYKAKFDEAVRQRNQLKPPFNEEYQELVEYYFGKIFAVGYFRDSYNSSNLLWRFELSYWESDLITDKGYLPPSEAARLLAMLREREGIFEESLQRVHELGWSDEPEMIVHYFRMKYLRLRVFLKMAIKLNEPIWWSV